MVGIEPTTSSLPRKCDYLCATSAWSRQEESNLRLNLRSVLFYPLNYGEWYPWWDSNPQNLTPQASAYTNSATRAWIK